MSGDRRFLRPKVGICIVGYLFLWVLGVLSNCSDKCTYKFNFCKSLLCVLFNLILKLSEMVLNCKMENRLPV
jgi:hypothetical protein